MRNKNILPISCIILYTNQGRDFPIPIWYTISMKMPIINHRDYQNIQRFSDNLLPRIIRINGVDYPYKSYNNIVEIDGILYNI